MQERDQQSKSQGARLVHQSVPNSTSQAGYRLVSNLCIERNKRLQAKMGLKYQTSATGSETEEGIPRLVSSDDDDLNPRPFITYGDSRSSYSSDAEPDE